MFERLKRLFVRKDTKPAVPRQRNFEPFPNGYTLVEWRKNHKLAEHLRSLLQEGTMRHALSVLYNQAPFGFPIRGEPVNETQANIELGRFNGYMECLALLQSLSVTPQQTENIDTEYGSERILDEWSGNVGNPDAAQD